MEEIYLGSYWYDFRRLRLLENHEERAAVGSFLYNYTEDTVYEDEIWKPVIDKNFEGFFVSSYGRVKTKCCKITFGSNSNGYKMVGVKVNGKKTTRKVHCLVMESFCGLSNLIVNHKDGNKSNNNLYNLEYVTYSENKLHSYNSGSHKKNFKPVIKYTLDGVPISLYKGGIIAKKDNNIIDLSHVLSGLTKTCKGYQWKYLEDVYPIDSDEYKIFIKELDNEDIILL